MTKEKQYVLLSEIENLVRQAQTVFQLGTSDPEWKDGSFAVCAFILQRLKEITPASDNINKE